MEGRGLGASESCLGVPVLNMHTEFEVFIASVVPEIPVFTDRITYLQTQTDRATDITTALHTASFAYIGGRKRNNCASTKVQTEGRHRKVTQPAASGHWTATLSW